MNKYISLVITFVILCTAIYFTSPKAQAAATSGTCGNNVTWNLDNDGVLTIAGSGQMNGWGAGYAPWYSHRDAIKTIRIYDGVTNIGYHAFYECNNVTSVTLPSSVTTIEGFAFAYCASLKTITIPNSVTSMGEYVFEHCTSLTSAVIPNSMRGIPAATFYNCSGLKSVTIPNSVSWIGKAAFSGCTALNEINIPDSVTNIYQEAFSSCGLKTIVIPDSVTTIGSHAFAYCTDATSLTIGKNLTSIGSFAFRECSSLTSVVIPDWITKIESGAFLACNGLKGVYINDIDAWYSIDFGNYEANPLYYAKMLYLDGEAVTHVKFNDGINIIRPYVFVNCNTLTSVEIPEGVTMIGKQAFDSCRNLTDVQFPNSLTHIDSGAFESCSALRWITIPAGTTIINSYAFYGCTYLTAVSIPSSVKTIGYCAFVYCNQLEHVNYSGSKTQWNNISIADQNNELKKASVFHYNTTAPYWKKDCINAGLFCLECEDFVVKENPEDGFHSYENTLDMECDDCGHVRYVKEIAFIQKPNILNYEVFTKQIDCTGGLLAVTYSDNVYCEIDISPEMVDGFNGAQLGRQTLRVTYGGIAITYDVNVVIGFPDKLSIYSMPQKFEYCVGDQMSTNGLAVIAYYGDNSLILTSEHLEIGSVDMSTTGLKTVQVSVGNVSTSFDVMVYYPELIIVTLPYKLNYKVGETLDLTGLSVKLHYGAQYEDVAINALTVGQVETSTAGHKTVYLQYGNAKAQFTIQVHSLTLTIIQLPEKMMYLVNENLDCSGLLIQGNYGTIESFEILVEDIIIDAPDMTTPGKKTVRIMYAESVVAFSIAIHAADQVQIDCSLYPESNHNYAANTDETKIFTYPGAEGLILTFSPNSFTEANYDFVYVLNGEGVQIGRYSGSALANLTVTVPGDTVQIRLVSDSGVNKYGYSFSSIVAKTVAHTFVVGECIICGERETPLGGYINGEYTGYNDLADAIISSDWIKLFEDVEVNMSLQKDLYIDLNGHNLSGQIITNGHMIYGMDSTTDSYYCASIGYFNCIDENGDVIVPVVHYRSDITGEVKRYISIKNDKGFSFHRFYLSITKISLQPNTAGVGYKAVFYGDEMVAMNLAGFGFNMQLGDNKPIVKLKADNFVSGKEVTLRINNYDVENFGETDLSAFAVLKLNDGTIIESEKIVITLRSVLEQLNVNHLNLNAEQKNAIADFIRKYTVMLTWKVENLV